MLKEFFKPSWMRVILFPVLLLFSPAIFEVCIETCGLKLKWLAGIKLLAMQEMGELSFPAMILWFMIAYFLACLITINYEYLMEY
ncbi:MAG: hypothetical protein V1914_00680 [archaeon]